MKSFKIVSLVVLVCVCIGAIGQDEVSRRKRKPRARVVNVSNRARTGQVSFQKLEDQYTTVRDVSNVTVKQENGVTHMQWTDADGFRCYLSCTDMIVRVKDGN